MLQGLAKETFGRSTTPILGHRSIDHVTIPLHRSPEVAELAGDLKEDLIQMPDIAQPALSAPLVARTRGPNFRNRSRTASQDTLTPRSASRSPTSRKPRANRWSRRTEWLMIAGGKR